MFNKQDEGSVKGQGAAILLPSRGSPFAIESQAPAAPEAALPFGAETAAAMPEPHDLSPEDLAALFPSSHADRDQSAPAAIAAAPPPASMPAAAPATEMSAEEMAALNPSSHAERGAPGEVGVAGGPASEVPPGAKVMPEVPITAPGMAIPSTTVVGGQALPGMRAFGGGPLQLSESVGISAEAYQREAVLQGKEELVKIFVPDGRLVTLWAEIDTVEAQVSAATNISLKVAREMLDRLATARNYLMNDRANFEEAVRQLAEVKYRLSRIRESTPSQRPRLILLYFFVFLTVVVLGFVATLPLSRVFGGLLEGAAFAQVWNTILWGGIGGLTGGMYGLWVHVARDQDYDPQYALWYYTNPLMGLILGAFVYIVLRAGVLPILSGGQEVQTPPYILYVLAWAVGFQQNLAFSLANAVLKRLIPEDEKGKGKEQPAPGPTDASTSGSK
ncbi:MAG: hypothetical protein HY784_16130 [Chloroflexi bacterium]|nr:hypothetical protein [Chloroflexota bacterium]